MNKQELLDITRGERKRLDELLTSLDARDVTTEGVIDGLSVKDLVAHIAAWERRLANALEAWRRRETFDWPEAGYNISQFNVLNDRDFAAGRSRTLDDVLAESRAQHQRAFALVESLEDATLFGDARPEFNNRQIAVVVRANMDEHYREHLDEIDVWRQSQLVSKETVMDEQALAFLQQHPAASMITLRPAGSPHAVRVAIAVVDGKVQSSGTRTRKRTAHLRRDPRSTLFVFDNEWRWLTLECDVTILDGPDVPRQSLRLFQAMQARITPPPPPGKILWYGAPKSEEEFLTIMREDERIIYEFDVKRAYGMYGEMPGR